MSQDLHELSVLTWTHLTFSHLLENSGLPTVSFLLVLIYCFCLNVCRNSVFYFSIRKTASFWIGGTTDVGRVSLLSISLNLLCPRVRPCECGCLHEDPIFPSCLHAWWIQLFCRWSTCGCLAVFPRLNKGRNNSIPVDYLLALVINRYITIILELISWLTWLKVFFIAVFVFPS
jgi:hypothetical protein